MAKLLLELIVRSTLAVFCLSPLAFVLLGAKCVRAKKKAGGKNVCGNLKSERRDGFRCACRLVPLSASGAVRLTPKKQKYDIDCPLPCIEALQKWTHLPMWRDPSSSRVTTRHSALFSAQVVGGGKQLWPGWC